MGAAVDCEAIQGGLFGQPVNSLTTIAFLVTGVWVIVAREDRRLVGAALVATGVGSFLFHGPMPPASQWAHDLTLGWLLAVVALTGHHHERSLGVISLALAGALFAAAPSLADPLLVVLSALAILNVLLRHDSRMTVAAVGLLGAAAAIGRLGATGGPLCDPGSLLQPHGLWHVTSAAAVAMWALSGDSGAGLLKRA